MHLNLQTCRAFAAALLLVGAGPTQATEPASSGEWEFGLDAHLWGAAIGGETPTGNEIDVSFRDILENLDFGLMAAAKAKKNKWSVVADIINLKIKADNGENFKVPVGRFTAPVEVDAKIVLKAWITTFGAGYNLVENDKWSLDLIGGARYLWLDATITLDAETKRLGRALQPSGSKGNWDGIVGVNGNVQFNDRWYLSYYGDVGAGDSDLTWAAQGILAYRFKKFDAYGGYRYMEWNDLSGNNAIKDLDLSGPILGARFKF